MEIVKDNIYAGTRNGFMLTFNMKASKQLKKWKAHEAKIVGICFQNEKIWTICVDGTARIWKKAKQIKELKLAANGGSLAKINGNVWIGVDKRTIHIHNSDGEIAVKSYNVETHSDSSQIVHRIFHHKDKTALLCIGSYFFAFFFLGFVRCV